jgi:1-acyl-sn-glycerol-3-phosphate acyltransferase
LAEPRFSFAALAAFELFFGHWMRRRIHAILLAGHLPDSLPPDRPIIFAANHVSWWDGFVLREVQRRTRPGWRIQVLMRESELRRFGFLRWLGAVGVDPAQPRSVLGVVRRVADYAGRHPRTTVLLFPQGRIWPSARRPLGFHRGVEVLARALDAVVVPTAIHVEPLNHPAPSVFVSLGRPFLPGDELSASLVEARVASELDRIFAVLALHGEDAADAWTRGDEDGPPVPPEPR